MATSAKKLVRKPQAAPARHMGRRQAIERAAGDSVTRYGEILTSLPKR